MTARTFERAYLEEFFKLQRQQWENYADGARHNLSLVEADLHHLLLESRGSLDVRGRKGDVIRAIVLRGLVDLSPEVSELRNRLGNLRCDSSFGVTDENRKRRTLARKMKPDLLKLIALRERLSQELGFPSYAHLVMFSEELDYANVKGLVVQYLAAALPSARELAVRHEMSWSNWFSQLEHIGEPVKIPRPRAIAMSLLNLLGLDLAAPRIRFVAREQSLSGFCAVLSVPDDVRILMRQVRSLHGLATLFHELGHGVSHSLNRAKGLYKTWTASHDESMACVLERIGTICLFDADSQRLCSDIRTLETVRCALSFLFELALCKDPDVAESAYVEHYERLDLPVEDPTLWTLDSFRFLDPIYVHNYVLGAVIADATAEFLTQTFGHDYRAWGKWLSKHYFAEGRRVSLREKVAGIPVIF